MHSKLVLFLLIFSRKRYSNLIVPEILDLADSQDVRVGGGGFSVIANS